MQERQISIHPDVNGFANGFWEIEQFGMRTINHGGDMAGFSAYMVFVPEKKIGIFVVHHHEGTKMRSKVISTILEYFGTTPKINPNPERMKEDISIYAGTYRYMTNCVNCPEGYQQITYELKANADNTLSGFGRKFYQTESLLFKSYDGKRIMGFLKNDKGGIQYMSLGNINAFEKIK
jgi:hypothetical protein